ncbi:kinase-like protein [Clavulina sp. PMI_390]|nr:kinase-like protein [Clavulina sp. PMI_390]
MDAGGEAIIWRARIKGETVIARDTRPPPSNSWFSPDGARILSVRFFVGFEPPELSLNIIHPQVIRREIISQIQIRHPNVIPILGVSSSPNHPLSIITPFVPNGSALGFLPGVLMCDKFADIASALDYLHVMNPPIIHGDLHGRNILVDAEEKGLLCDFGQSRIKHEQTRSMTDITEGGKFRYLAPELLANSTLAGYKFRTTPASDCYAFAMTMLELATLDKPFSEFENERAAFHAAEQGIRPGRPTQEAFGKLGERRTEMLWELLTSMWDHDPAKRPSMHCVNIRIVEIICVPAGTHT